MTAELFITSRQLLVVDCGFGAEVGHRMGPHPGVARLLAEMSQSGRDAGPVTEDTARSLLLVSEVLVKYLEHAEVYYSDNGNPGKEFRAMVDAVAPVNGLYGDLLADNFGPLNLKSIRQHMIDRDLCRTEINKQRDDRPTMAKKKTRFSRRLIKEIVSLVCHGYLGYRH
jgi:hypothetical protein